MKILSLLLSLISIPLLAQNFPTPNYPTDYFSKPVHIPLSLSGNYGELRPGHFHEGLDIRTRGVIGYRVYAAADGYISRIKRHSTGFGNVIYITHPNGYTTVYAHLHSFIPEVEAYVKQKQYEKESWAVDLFPTPDKFPVTRGQKIALSGMTGSAGGPHVHFEIRNTQSEHPLNGQLFRFPIQDNIPPRVYRLAIYDRTQSIYEQSPKIVKLYARGSHYGTSPYTITTPLDKIGLGIQTLDKENGTHFSYGIYRSALFVDNSPQIGFQLDDIGYEETRYVDAHYDYKTYKEKHQRYQLLFDLPGNRLPIYHNFKGNGSIDLTDGKTHAIKITVTDADGNTSKILFNIRKNGAKKPNDPTCNHWLKANENSQITLKNTAIQLNKTSLYDDVCLDYRDITTQKAGYYSNLQQIHHPYVPVYDDFTLKIKPNQPIPKSLESKLVLVRTENGHREEVTPAQLKQGWVVANVRAFGTYSVQVDTEEPTLSPFDFHNGSSITGARDIRIKINDNKSGIASYRAELDGKWIMFSKKGNLLKYELDEHFPPGSHTLTLTATDYVGNTTTKSYRLSR